MRPNNNINYYKSLDKLKILLFWDILKTGNVCLLDIDYYDGKRYNQDVKHELTKEWERLYDEYFLLRNDTKSKAELNKGFDGVKLLTQINLVQSHLNLFRELYILEGHLRQDEVYKKRMDLYKTLKDTYSGTKPQLFNSVDLDIEYVGKLHRGLQNSYNLNYKPLDKVYDEQVQNVYDVLANVESWLERSLPIDDITVSRWLAYENQVIKKQIAQSNGKQ